MADDELTAGDLADLRRWLTPAERSQVDKLLARIKPERLKAPPQERVMVGAHVTVVVPVPATISCAGHVTYDAGALEELARRVATVVDPALRGHIILCGLRYPLEVSPHE